MKTREALVDAPTHRGRASFKTMERRTRRTALRAAAEGRRRLLRHLWRRLATSRFWSERPRSVHSRPRQFHSKLARGERISLRTRSPSASFCVARASGGCAFCVPWLSPST